MITKMRERVKIMKKLIRVLIITLMIATPVVPVMEATTVSVSAATKVKLSATKKSINKGASFNLALKGAKSAKWSTSNKKVATIKKVSKTKYKITGKKAGKVTITAKVGKKTYKCNVTVESPKISKSKLSLKVNGNTTLKMTGTKANVKWATSNKAIATVNKNGKVTAKKVGSATISTKVNGKTYKCKVTVVKPTVAPTATPVPVSKPQNNVVVPVPTATPIPTGMYYDTSVYNKKTGEWLYDGVYFDCVGAGMVHAFMIHGDIVIADNKEVGSGTHQGTIIEKNGATIKIQWKSNWTGEGLISEYVFEDIRGGYIWYNGKRHRKMSNDGSQPMRYLSGEELYEMFSIYEEYWRNYVPTVTPTPTPTPEEYPLHVYNEETGKWDYDGVFEHVSDSSKVMYIRTEWISVRINESIAEYYSFLKDYYGDTVIGYPTNREEYLTEEEKDALPKVILTFEKGDPARVTVTYEDDPERVDVYVKVSL